MREAVLRTQNGNEREVGGWEEEEGLSELSPINNCVSNVAKFSTFQGCTKVLKRRKLR